MDLQLSGFTPEASLQFRAAALRKATVQVSTVAVSGYVRFRSRLSHRLVAFSLSPHAVVRQHTGTKLICSPVCTP